MDQTNPSARVTMEPSGCALGAEIRGVDIRATDDSGFASIRRAWLDPLVLLFRGQRLSDDDLIAFSRRFGELDWAPVLETGRRIGSLIVARGCA